MKYIIALTMLLTSLSVYAACTTNTFILQDKMVVCTTCCVNGSCTTSCI